jgi:asparagine synthase (glutamine-hydrolysing)
MCGIAVILDDKAPELLDRMLDAERHRGPDDRGVFVGPGCSLGHVRLSIIDVAGGHQPIFSQSGDTCIVFNGEIYNFRELRRQLSHKYAFRTGTDTEVVLCMYQEDGPSFVERLDGMFALAIYDRGQVLVARDRIGIKPLYYGLHNGHVCFASEYKAMMGLTDVREFPPGHLFTAAGGFSRYYDIPVSEQKVDDVDALLPLIRSELERAVVKRLVSDVPVGVFLSGGLDSSVVAALMRAHLPNLQSFAVGMAGAEDLRAAREVAAFLGTSHFELEYDRDEMLRVLPEVIFHLESFDAPLVRSAIPGFLVSRLACRHVKVVLTGEGADELFSGYHYLKEINSPAALHQELLAITGRLHHSNLQRTDRMTMAHSVEARVPFLDHAVIALAFSIPIELKLPSRDRPEKWLLRKACETLLPEDIIWRKKQKFSEGAGSARSIEPVAEEIISDAAFEKERAAAAVAVRSKEELLYYRLFCERFGVPESEKLVGRTADYN